MSDEKMNIVYRGVSVILTVLIIPLTLWIVTSYSEREKIRQEYVRIALGILQPAEKLQRPPTAGLRAWAVAIIQDSAPIKLSPSDVKSLVDGTSNFTYTLPTITPIYSTGTTYTEPDHHTSEYNYASPDHANETRPMSPRAQHR